jgi:hypothetical protein
MGGLMAVASTSFMTLNNCNFENKETPTKLVSMSQNLDKINESIGAGIKSD